MPTPTIEFAQFRLLPGVSSDRVDTCSAALDRVLASQPGFVSRRLLRDGDTWADLVEWRSRDDALAALAIVESSPEAGAYFALIDMPSARMQHFDVHR